MKTYEDQWGNTRCSICLSKVEGGYCDCIAYEIQAERKKALEDKKMEDVKNEQKDR